MTFELKSHVDFEEIGQATFQRAQAVGRFEATGISLPSPFDEAWTIHAEAGGREATTSVFEAVRLTELTQAAAGDTPAAANALPLSQLGGDSTTHTFWSFGITDASELLFSHRDTSSLGDDITINVFHLRPSDVGPDDLDTGLTARVLPVATEATRGRYIQQSPDGETYQLATGRSPAASSDIYATAAEYRERTDAGTRVEDDLLEEQLSAASRLIDHELRVVPGHFTPTTGTYIFSTDGGTVLRFRDESGLAHGLRSVDADGIKPDYNLTGKYDQEGWDLDDAWIWPRARNALAQGLPYHALELRPLSNVPSAGWPSGGGSVQIAGAWGWPATPAPIRDVTVHVAREMRDSLRGGAAARVEVIDDTVSYRDDAWRLWQTVKRRYGRIPARAR